MNASPRGASGPDETGGARSGGRPATDPVAADHETDAQAEPASSVTAALDQLRRVAAAHDDDVSGLS
ncbi:MAG TPA: hypothetical protein VHY31_03540 [Streptosporangiaceae bacterium]|jgi:hypothetical protein|nr:hypothetical protein [Streptosporangiaceae bacterium]